MLNKFFKSISSSDSGKQYYEDALIYGDTTHLQYDPVKAEELMLKACRLGYRDAIIFLADYYSYRGGTDEEIKRTEGFLLPLVRKNDDVAMVYLADIYISQKKYKEAISLLESAIQFRNPVAFNNLGLHYMEGNIVKQDLRKAEEYLLKSVELYNMEPVFFHNLYLLYAEHGSHLCDRDKSRKKALYYLKKSADLGYETAIFDLVKVYREGLLGYQKDITKAKTLLNDLCIRGNATAKRLYRNYFNEASLGETEEDRKAWAAEEKKKVEDKQRKEIEMRKYIEHIYGAGRKEFIKKYVDPTDYNKSKEDLFLIVRNQVEALTELNKDIRTAYGLLAVDKGSIEALEYMLLNDWKFLMTDEIRLKYLTVLASHYGRVNSAETLFEIYKKKYKSEKGNNDLILKEMQKWFEVIINNSDTKQTVDRALDLFYYKDFPGWEKLALKALEKAKAEGFEEGVDSRINYLYLCKNSGKFNPARGLKYFESDEAQKDEDAMDVLGKIYEKGIGVNVDLKKAEEAYQKAIDIRKEYYNGSVTDFWLENINRVREKQKPQMIKHYEDRYGLLAESGDEDSMMVMADMYASSPVYEYGKALHYYEELAKKGNKDAMYKISKFPKDQNIYKNIFKWEEIGSVFKTINDYQQIALFYEQKDAIDEFIGSNDYAGKSTLNLSQKLYLRYYFTKRKIELSLGDPAENAKRINGHNNYYRIRRVLGEFSKNGYYDVDIDLESVNLDDLLANDGRVLFNLGVMSYHGDYYNGKVNAWDLFNAAAKKGIKNSYLYLSAWENCDHSNGTYIIPSHWDELGKDSKVPGLVINYHLLNMCSNNYSEESKAEAVKDLEEIKDLHPLAKEIIEALDKMEKGVLDISTNIDYSDEYKNYVPLYLKNLEVVAKRRSI